MSRNLRLGAFLLVAIAILIVGIFLIGSQKFLFGSTYPIKAQFASVAGLDVGADVQIGGVRSGTVSAIELPRKAGEQVTVRMQLNQSTHAIVKQDSVASIQTEGLLGNQFVSISFGSAGQAEVKDGDTLKSVPPLEIGALLDKANGLLGQGQQAMTDITQVAEHLSSVTAKIDSGNGTVGALVNDKTLYNSLDKTAESAHSAAESAQKGVSDFADNMEALKHNFLLRGYFKNRGYEDSSDLGKDEITALPAGTPVKEFTLQSKDLFSKQDSAKLKGQRALNAAGAYLADNEFGLAVVEVSTGKVGSTEEDLTLAQGRALVVREYMVQHYGFDDSRLKTVALGKQPDKDSKADWGLVRVLVYPEGTAIPPPKLPDALKK